MHRTLAAFLFIATIIGAASPARAQEENRFAVGLGFTTRNALDPAGHGNGGISLKWRFGRDQTGWGWHYGLNWYTTDIDRTVGGNTIPLGELKIRPFLGGYGYTRRINPKLSITGSAIAGFAFTSFELASRDNRSLATSEPLNVHVGAIPVVRPEVAMWYDLNKKFGLAVSAGYIIARPRITVTTLEGSSTSRFRADTVSISAGLVYSIF